MERCVSSNPKTLSSIKRALIADQESPKRPVLDRKRPFFNLTSHAVCCIVWQCVAVCCSALHCSQKTSAAYHVCCSVLQCVAVCCIALVNRHQIHIMCVAVCYSVQDVQHTSTFLRFYICHHSSVEKSAGLNKFGLSAGPRFDSGRNPVNSHDYGLEQKDSQARVLNYWFQ